MNRYTLLNQIEFELSDLLNELHYLRIENKELMEYKEKYNELLQKDVNNGKKWLD